MVLVLYPSTTTYLVLCALFRPRLKMLCQSDIAVPCIALASCDALLVYQETAWHLRIPIN